VPEGRRLVRAGPFRRHRTELVDDARRAGKRIRAHCTRSTGTTGDYGRDVGAPPWCFRRPDPGQITAEQARSEYVRLYANGFTNPGYRTVLDRQITKANGTPMYFLIFATDNNAGERIVDWVFDRVRIRVNEQLGQTTLFDMESGPRERRLGES
jgi:hypothetical protein